MEKIKTIFKWVAGDGLQHLETVALIVLAFTPIIGFVPANIIAIMLGLAREIIQYVRGKNTKEQVHHDLICDAAGLLLADCTIFIWCLCNL